ncbi:MAG: dimethylamine/trimethylamine dehydrogenase, partial [Gammaproteobacteria bacterium]
GLRGYQVVLAEAGTVLGGRVAKERLLPGLAAWGRVADYREYQISQMENVDVYLDNKLSADDVLEFGFEHVLLATGSSWRKDGVARAHIKPIPNDQSLAIYTPDDLTMGNVPSGHIVLFDDDHYYMGGVIAELLVNNGATVTLVTPAAYVSEWTNNTLEQATIHRKLVELGVEIVLNRSVVEIIKGQVITECVYSRQQQTIDTTAVAMVTSRVGNDSLWNELIARENEWADHGIQSIKLIGDAESPAPIAWATYAGHRYARELDMPDIGDDLPFRREVAQLKD